MRLGLLLVWKSANLNIRVKFKMERIAVLGGSRFIGFHLTWALFKEGYKVTLFNRGITSSPEPLPIGIEYVRGDRNNPTDLGILFSKEFDAVIDLSGYTRNQLETLVSSYWSQIGHYLFCSTSSVYEVPPICPVSENSPLGLQEGTYGGDKALTEKVLLKHASENSWPVTIFRPQAVFGPHDATQACFVFNRLLDSHPIALKQGKNTRINFLFVDDLIKAFLMAMNNASPVYGYGRVYGVAGDDVTTQAEFIELCGEVCSCNPLLNWVNDKAYCGVEIGVKWLDYDLVTDNSKIKRELGMAFIPLHSGLSTTLSWFLRNLDKNRYYQFRGENYVLRNRPIPKYLCICWWLSDLRYRILSRIKSLVNLCVYAFDRMKRVRKE